MNDSFRDQLLKLEQTTPDLKVRYDTEINAMFEKQVSGTRRWIWLGCALFGAGFAILFGTLAIMAPTEFPLGARITFAAGALFGIGWLVLGLKVFWRGSIDLKFDSATYAGMAWALPVTIVTILMVSAPDSIVGLRMIVSGMVFLVMGLAFLLRHVIEQSELKTREKLLEIEYQLAELAETTKSRATQN